ncbi:MAG: hypothetical protein ABW133_07035 [Polyangiaceae bacterium]
MTSVKDDEVRTFLEAYGRALSEGNLRGVSAAWETPALVLSDRGAIEVQSAKQIEEFFGAARRQYTERGIVTTKPQIAKLEWLSDKMVQVRARWLLLTANKDRKGEELSLYVLRRDDEDKWRIRVTIALAGEL